MIKVLINGTPIYKLCFERRVYSHVKAKGKDVVAKRQPLYETSAIVYLADAKRGEPAVAKASVRQHHKDKYSRESARVAALKQLLRANPLPTPFKRLERAAIWKAYWNRPRPVGNNPQTPVQPPTTGSAPPLPAVEMEASGHRVVNRLISFPQRLNKAS